MFRAEQDRNTVKVEFTTHDAVVVIWGNGETTIEVQDLKGDPDH